uniref:Acid tail secreted protein n=1 Tax=Rhipicephalus appendiculatus TaxID=34631 RepID=A0A131YW19_RHIAP
MNAVLVLLFIASALFINECYTEDIKTTPIPDGQCVTAICERRLNHLGKVVTTACPAGCLCVVREASNIVPANGTCYALANTTTKTPAVQQDDLEGGSARE